MKDSGQNEVLTAIPIVVARPSEDVTIAQPCAQKPSTPYARDE